MEDISKLSQNADEAHSIGSIMASLDPMRKEKLKKMLQNSIMSFKDLHEFADKVGPWIPLLGSEDPPQALHGKLRGYGESMCTQVCKRISVATSLCFSTSCSERSLSILKKEVQLGLWVIDLAFAIMTIHSFCGKLLDYHQMARSMSDVQYHYILSEMVVGKEGLQYPNAGARCLIAMASLLVEKRAPGDILLSHIYFLKEIMPGGSAAVTGEQRTLWRDLLAGYATDLQQLQQWDEGLGFGTCYVDHKPFQPILVDFHLRLQLSYDLQGDEYQAVRKYLWIGEYLGMQVNKIGVQVDGVDQYVRPITSDPDEVILVGDAEDKISELLMSEQQPEGLTTALELVMVLKLHSDTLQMKTNVVSQEQLANEELPFDLGPQVTPKLQRLFDFIHWAMQEFSHHFRLSDSADNQKTSDDAQEERAKVLMGLVRSELGECPVCLEALDEGTPMALLACDGTGATGPYHAMCAKCWDGCCRRQCPLCRQSDPPVFVDNPQAYIQHFAG